MNREPIHSELRTPLSIGQKVVLDEGYANSSIVEVVKQTQRKLFTTVTDGESQWNVMTYRLKPIKSESKHGVGK